MTHNLHGNQEAQEQEIELDEATMICTKCGKLRLFVFYCTDLDTGLKIWKCPIGHEVKR